MFVFFLSFSFVFFRFLLFSFIFFQFLSFSFIFFFLFFLKKKVSSFLFSCISFTYVLLLALVSEFNCFLRSRCSMEMWCPDDIGRDSWDWVGPPAWERACFNSPERGGGSSPVKTELPRLYYCCCCCCLGHVFNSVFGHNCDDDAISHWLEGSKNLC